MFTAAQGGVLEKNLVSVMKGKPLTAKVSYFISTMGPSCMIYYGAVMHDMVVGFTTDVVSSNLDQGEVYNIM
jgi:hypothetical protein